MLIFSFQKKLTDAPISGSRDSPEGGMDGLLQTIVCEVSTLGTVNLLISWQTNFRCVHEIHFILKSNQGNQG